MFSKEIIIRFREADPAGILWFGNIMALAHDAFEDFIVFAGFQWQEWFKTTEYLIPIRHADIDFLAPFIPGETYQISAAVESFSDSSFKMKYVFKKAAKVHAQIEMVHTFLDAKSMKKINIPIGIKLKLEKQKWKNN